MASSSETSGGLQDYFGDYLEMTKRIDDGREFTTQALGFWQKLAKLQQSFARGVLNLCQGKRATMEKLLLRSKINTDGSKEHVRELREAWSCLVGEVEEMGKKYEEMSEHIEKQITKPIDSFIKRKLAKQSTTALNGKRSLLNLQFNYRVVRAGRKKFVDASDDDDERKKEAVEEDESEVKLEQDTTEFSTEARKLKDEHQRVFTVILPGIIEELNLVEQERVELLYSCMNQFVRKAGESVQFEKTVASLQTALENSSKIDLTSDRKIPEHDHLISGDYNDEPSQEDSKFSLRGMFKKSEGNKENAEGSKGRFSFNWRGWFKKKPKGEENEEEETDSEPDEEKEEAE